MKIMKKITVLMLAICLMVSNFTMITQAASGKIMFTDPSTAVGETLELKGVVTSSTNIEDRTVEMTYDTTMLKFKNGDNVTETEAGKLVYEVTGKRDGNRVEFLMYFDVLKEGTTEVKAVSYKAWDSSDDKIQCQMGYASIKIAAGEAPVVQPEQPEISETITVDVNGDTYTFSSDFSAELIPEGFAEGVLDYAGAQHRVVTHPDTGVTLGYLVDNSGAGKFFLYNVDDATFSAYEQIDISDTTSIVLLSNVEGITLPENYVETTVEVNGNNYPAWRNTDDTALCIIYAVNSNGMNSLYQYDTTECTYQRFTAPEVVEEQEDESMFGKVASLLENHLDYAILGTGLGFILFILVIIILSVKLYNRNAELDELYDEFGIDVDDEDDEKDDDSDESEDLMENFDEDESEGVFVNIDEEAEDDIMLEETGDEEIEVEFFEQSDVKRVEETTTQEKILISKDVIAQEETEFFDDEDDDDFEIDFIDLDD